MSKRFSSPIYNVTTSGGEKVAIDVTNSISAGRFGLRDIAWATGRVPHPEDVVPPKADMVEAAFKDTDPAELQASAAAVDAAIELVKAIDCPAIVQSRPNRGSTRNWCIGSILPDSAATLDCPSSPNDRTP